MPSHRQLLASLGISIALLSSAYANTDNQSPWFLTAGYGFSTLQLNHNASIVNGANYPAPYNVDAYSITTHANPNLGQLSLGYRRPLANAWLTDLETSISYQHFFSTPITGQIQQYSLPEFNNYSYRLRYEADAFMLAGKFDFMQPHIMPYLTLGVGVMLNHINNYTEQAQSGVTARISPDYQGKTIFNPALLIGAGLDFVVNENIKVSLGYAHYFQGSLQTGAGSNSWSNNKLSLGKLTLDSYFVSVTATIPETFRS